MSDSVNITHNTSENRFETTIDEQTAILTYQDLGDSIVYEHTIVPQELSGQGVGSALAKHALDYARQNNKKVVPQCSFIEAYINKHPDYKDLV